MQKLIKTLGMLLKFRHYVNKAEVKNIYHAIFESHLRYGCQIWFLSSIQFTREKVGKLQKKVLRIMYFSDLKEPYSPLFKEWKILKIKDIVEIQNCLLNYQLLVSQGKAT